MYLKKFKAYSLPSFGRGVRTKINVRNIGQISNERMALDA
jgi:hypothetical protein